MTTASYNIFVQGGVDQHPEEVLPRYSGEELHLPQVVGTFQRPQPHEHHDGTKVEYLIVKYTLFQL